MQSNGHTTKKSRFTFGKKKNEDANPMGTHDNQDLVEQLRTLSDRLTAIDRDLYNNGVTGQGHGGVTLDGRMKYRKNVGGSYDLESSGADSAIISGGGNVNTNPYFAGMRFTDNSNISVARSNSLKNSVQKLAHKTFNLKPNWHKHKKLATGSESSDTGLIDDANTNAVYLNSPEGNNTNGVSSNRGNNNGVNRNRNFSAEEHNDVIDVSHKLMRTWPAREASFDSEEGSFGVGETFLPPPSSFTCDDPNLSSSSPLSSPRSSRSLGSTSSDKVQGQGQQRQNVLDDGRVARRRVDPDAMATIEAFELMSRQALGEGPT